MAGTGVKLFLSGEVAYAADVNTYLMDQVVAVFDDSTERNNAYGDGVPVSLGGTGKPSLSPGRFCYLIDPGEVQYYDGTSWQASSQFSIEDGAITEIKLANLAVTTGKIANLAVTEGKIAASAVTSAKIADDNVIESKILNSAVTTNKIAANAVTASRFRQSVSTSVVGNATGSTADVADIQASSDATVLRRNGSALEFAKITNTNVDDAAAISSTKLGPISVTSHVGASGSTISASYANRLITVDSATAFNLGLTGSDVSYPIGTTITFVQIGTGKLTFQSHDSSVLVTPISGALSCRARYSVVSAIKIASLTWLLAGDLST